MSEYIWYVRVNFMCTNSSFFMYPPHTVFESHYSAHPPPPPPPPNPLTEPWAIPVSILMAYWRYSRPPINYNVLISISLLINAQGSSSQWVRTGTAKQWGRVLFCSRDLIKSQFIVCPKRGAYFNEQNSCVRRASCASTQGYVGIQHQATLLTASFRCAVI
jgi:hypothetical protein